MTPSGEPFREDVPAQGKQEKRSFLFLPEEMLSFLENLPLIVIAVDRQGNIRFYNERMERYAVFLGIREGSLPKNVASFFGKRPDWREWLFRGKENDTTSISLQGRLEKEDGPWLSIEWKVLLRQQELIWLSGNVSSREIVTSREIGDENFFRKAFEASLNGIAIIDTDGNILTANKTALDIFRIPEYSGGLKLNLFDLMTRETRENIDFKGRFREDGMVYNKVYEMIRPDGEVFYIEASSAAMHNSEGETEYVVSTFRDITEELRQKKELEEALKRAEESDRLKTAFLTNMSHEIRTPMNAIVGFSGMLANPEVPEEDKKEYIKYIELSSDTLLHLINDILDISKLEAGQIIINNEEFFVDDLFREVEAIAREIQSKYGKSYLDLRFYKTGQERCPVVRSDPHRIKQVLNNLIGNAIKFTEEGYVEVTCSAREQVLTFMVRDTGPGIPEEEQQTIFERFRQLDNSFTRKYGGAGLGLAITKNLVESLGGEIRLFSTPGEGTLFRVRFPGVTLRESPDHAVQGEEDTPQGVPDWRDRYVLIAEDERSNFDLLEAILAKTQIRIRHAWTGREAVTMCREGERPDLLLMDLRMPEMDGLSALKEIRSIYPGIPAIAQTAFAMADERHRCLRNGFDDYLAKPIRASLLLEKMGRALEQEQKKGADL